MISPLIFRFFISYRDLMDFEMYVITDNFSDSDSIFIVIHNIIILFSI